MRRGAHSCLGQGRGSRFGYVVEAGGGGAAALSAGAPEVVVVVVVVVDVPVDEPVAGDGLAGALEEVDEVETVEEAEAGVAEAEEGGGS